MSKTFLRDFRRGLNIWSVFSVIAIALVLLPNLNIFLNLFSETSENWPHIKEYLLKDYIKNSLILVFFTSINTILIGFSLSWLISVYEFPFKKFFKWSLILPITIPPNIAAYTYSGMLSYTGIIQTTLRNRGIVLDQSWFKIMSMEGAIFIFTFFLFPYVYIITKSFLQKQSSSLIETARVLGKSPIEIFFKVGLPISRPSIIGGVSLVILEVLNDFGVVSYFGINTFSTAIFTVWFGMYDLNSAIRLAGILMGIVIAILLLEKLIRGRKKYSFTTSKLNPLKPKKLIGKYKYLATAFCSVVFLISFIIPFIQLLNWGLKSYKNVLDDKFIQIIWNTVKVSVVSSIVIIIFSIIISNYTRMSKSKFSKVSSKLAMLGYSIPAAVIAIGIMTFFIFIDKLIWEKLVFSTSLIMLMFSYSIRYLGIGYNTIDAGFEKIGNKYLESSRLLGVGVTKSFFKVDLPMIKSSILVGGMLVIVDILKELPLALILRPFNFNTLATKTYQYAVDENIQYASVPALIIIFISIIAVLLLNMGDKER